MYVFIWFISTRLAFWFKHRQTHSGFKNGKIFQIKKKWFEIDYEYNIQILQLGKKVDSIKNWN